MREEQESDMGISVARDDHLRPSKVVRVGRKGGLQRDNVVLRGGLRIKTPQTH